MVQVSQPSTPETPPPSPGQQEVHTTSITRDPNTGTPVVIHVFQVLEGMPQ